MSKLHVAKIVATATDTAWSQAYHAGGVTAVISVQHKEDTPADSLTSLHIVGKDLLNTFESEYFPLETKNLTSIKKAVTTTYKKSSETHKISFLVAVVVQNALYVLLAGEGKISLFRQGKQAVLLEQSLEEAEILSGSGFLVDGDIVVLETLVFSDIVSGTTLSDVLMKNNPTDAAEILSPKIHEVQEGAAVSLIFSYEEPEEVDSGENQREKQEEIQHENKPHQELPPEPLIAKKAVLPTFPSEQKKKKSLSHRQKLFLTVAVILTIVFIATIFISINHKQQNQTSTLFATLFPPAEKKYEEGQGLLTLNKQLAQDDLSQSKDLLQKAAPQFPSTSQEEQQINDLLSKVNASLNTLSQANQVQAQKIDASASPLLSFVKSQSSQYITQDDSNYYVADNKAITRVNKKSSVSTQIIKNNNTWKSVDGLSTYLGNFYLLDTADGIQKFIPTGGNFASSQYFSGQSPDLSKGVSIAIDGSIWILTSDGNILKYTKGAQDSFSLTGMDKSLSSPTQIITTVDSDNIYLLDKGNSRIVVVKKTGSFVQSYASDIVKNATFMDVSETDKKAYVLSNGDLYQITLQ